MKRIISYLFCFLFLISAAIAFAEIKSLIKEYTYQASELDSRNSCRAIALEQVKRELLEELGSYIESTTLVQNGQIEKDEIKTISAGVVQTKILAENWDGKYFWLKAEVSADPNEVAASIEKIRNDQKLIEELAESQTEKKEALQEVDRLKAELSKSNADKETLAQYHQAVNQLQAANSFEQGTALTVAGDYEGATKAYDRVIYLRPKDPKAYFGRSIVYIFLGNYSRATQDLDRAMVIRPANTNAYFQRASAYKSLREERINDPNWRPLPGQPRRPIVPVPKQDPLKNYLDNKQAQNKLVKINPFQPRPAIKKEQRQDTPLTIRQKQQKTTIDQPVRPDIYRKSHISQPTTLDKKSSVVTPRVDAPPRSIQKRNLNDEQKRVWQQQQKEKNEKISVQTQQRMNKRQSDGSVVRQPIKPEVRKQVVVPPPNQPRVERKPSPSIERVQKKELKKEKKNLKKLEKDHDEDKKNIR